MEKIDWKTHRAIDKAAVLQVIHNCVTTSPSELAKNLNVDRATVYRRLKEINQEEIDQASGVITEGDLKPAETDFTLFCKIPEIERYAEILQYMRKNTPKYTKKRSPNATQSLRVAQEETSCSNPSDGSKSTNENRK